MKTIYEAKVISRKGGKSRLITQYLSEQQLRRKQRSGVVMAYRELSKAEALTLVGKALYGGVK